MYRCKDCGKEYKEKVDYCDCGNNTFDYIEEFIPVENFQKQSKKSFTVNEKSELISKIFFLICLILSLIVWLIPVKIDKVVDEEIKVQVDFKSIPNIEKIWNSTPPKVETPVAIEEKSPLDGIRQDIPDKILNKPVQTNIQPKQNSVQNKNISQNKPAKQNKNTTSKNTTNKNDSSKSTQQVNKPVANDTKGSSTSQAKPISTQQVQNRQTSNPNNLKPKQKDNNKTGNTDSQITQLPKPVEQPKPVYNPNSPAMLKYKGSLRAALFAKLPIGSVQGSGSCSIQFAVDKSGKLINRGFIRQSDNKSLNDAVYYMLMSVPHFASPPDGYNQELIKMNINMNADGSYEITIK